MCIIFHYDHTTDGFATHTHTYTHTHTGKMPNMSEIYFRHAQRAAQKVAWLALATAVLAVTLVAVPLPASIPLIGDNIETASAHPGEWRTSGGYYARIPNGNQLVSRCVQHDIDPATNTWVCVRTQSSWEPVYRYEWVPVRRYWHHQSHISCSKPVQVTWAAVNTALGAIPNPYTRAASTASSSYQISNAVRYC